MKNKNAQAFEKWLIEQGGNIFDFRDSNNDADDSTLAECNYRLKKGQPIMIHIYFLGDRVEVVMEEFAPVDEETASLKLFKRLNEFNVTYNSPKIYIQDNDIKIQNTTFYSAGFDPNDVMHYVVSLLDVVEKIYPELMRIIWS